LTFRPEFVHRQPLSLVWFKLYQLGLLAHIGPERVGSTFPGLPRPIALNSNRDINY
jgi:hypothetical protein